MGSFSELNSTPATSPDCQTLSSLFGKAIRRLMRCSVLSILWRRLLVPAFTSLWLPLLVGGLAPGAAVILRDLAVNPGLAFPDVDKLNRLLHPAYRLRRYGVYLKLGVPRDPSSGLPYLIYVGSATGAMGLGGRQSSSGETEDRFFTYWHKHDREYFVAVLELWSLDLNIAKASYSSRVKAAILTILAEATLMLLMGTHSELHQGFKAGFKVDPRQYRRCNKSDPVSSFVRTQITMLTDEDIKGRCGECGMMFANATGRARHDQRRREVGTCWIDPDGYVKCHKCDMRFEGPNRVYLLHIHTTSVAYQEDRCQDIHARVRDRMPEVIHCDRCAKPFRGKNRLRDREVHQASLKYAAGKCADPPPPEVARCDTCTSTWSGEKRLANQRLHMSTIFYQGGYCDPGAPNYITHWASACDRCPRLFTTVHRNKDLKSHKSRAGYGKYRCARPRTTTTAPEKFMRDLSADDVERLRAEIL